MKVIVAGSRTISDKNVVEKAIKESGFNITELVCGMAQGVDRTAYLWGISQDLPIKKFYPDWGKYGRPAGLFRNREMGLYADALVAVWNKKSRGTKYMIEYMRDVLKKPTFVLII